MKYEKDAAVIAITADILIIAESVILWVEFLLLQKFRIKDIESVIWNTHDNALQIMVVTTAKCTMLKT